MQQLRVQYWQEIGEVKLEDLVFVNETGSNVGMTRRYACSLKDSRAYNNAPYQRDNNLKKDWYDGVERNDWRDDKAPGATDGLAFKTYVAQVLVPNLWPGAMRA